MQINAAALQKVKDATMTGDNFGSVLEAIAAPMAFTGASSTYLTLDYQHDDIPVERGDLIPYITIGLRQATLPQMSPEEAQARAEAAEQQAVVDEVNGGLEARLASDAEAEQELAKELAEDDARHQAEAAIKPVADALGVTDDERGAIVDHFNDMVNKTTKEDE